MTGQQATSVIAAPMTAVQARLRDVQGWPEFLSGLLAVEPTGFERYRFILDEGGRTRTVPVCVVDHPAEHRISWHQLEGPKYAGELRLRAAGAHRTRVELHLTVDPGGLGAGLREMLGERHDTAQLDLRRLEELLVVP